MTNIPIIDYTKYVKYGVAVVKVLDQRLQNNGRIKLVKKIIKDEIDFSVKVYGRKW